MNVRFPLLAVVIFVGLTSVNWSPEEVGIALNDPALTKLHGTIMLPTPDDAIPKGKNALWCATFQMAWDNAGESLGRPILLEPACKLADALNRNPFDRQWVDEASVATVEGAVAAGVLDKIDAAVRAKTGQESKLLGRIKANASKDDLVFFAMLHKNLEFVKPFGKLGTWAMGGRQVPWFGFTPENKNTRPLREQVRVHHYAAKNDFVIELQSRESGDQLLLAKLPAAPDTPAAISRSILQHLQADAPHADPGDLLAVPNVTVSEIKEFTELEGHWVKGKELLLKQALQSIDFRMDEKGVKLDSEASISFGCSPMVEHVQPRLIVLDPPFALIMKRHDAPQAYFVAWFANVDLLGGK